MRITLCRDAYAAALNENYKVAECRQNGREKERGKDRKIEKRVALEDRTDALSDGTFRAGRKKILRIIYAPLVVRLQGKYAQIGYTLA